MASNQPPKQAPTTGLRGIRNRMRAQRRAARRLQAIEDVRGSVMFDAAWYISQLDAELSDVDAAEHYVVEGARRGLSPHPLFHPGHYRRHLRGYSKNVRIPLLDFIRRGAAKGVPSHPFFDPSFYLKQCPEAAEHPLGPVGHYIEVGWRTGVRPHPKFDDARYAESRAYELSEAPLVDFLRRATPRIRAVKSYRRFKRIAMSFDQDRAAEFVSRQLKSVAKMEQRPLVSIVLPTQNRADTLPESIASVLEQTYQEWELLIVDDGSTDGTDALVAEYTDPRIRLLRREVPTGVSAARNFGLEHAQGTYIAYLDSDKTWVPDFLAVMVGFLSSTEHRAVYSAARLLTSTPRWLGNEPNIDALLEENYIDCVTFVHERSLIDEVGGYDVSLRRMVDWELFLRIALHTPLGYAPFVGSKYDPFDPRPDRITNRESKGWYWVVREKYLLDWEQAAKDLPNRVKGRTSIVIPAYGHPGLTTRCIESIFANTEGDIEVILVDNGSVRGDPYVFLYLEEIHPRLRVLRLPQNMMFALGSNAGAVASTGDVIVFLNNDTTVTPGWLDPLRAQLDAGAAAVQPLLLYPDGTVQCAGVVFDPTGMPYHVFRDFPGDAPEVTTAARRRALTAACVAMRAEDVVELQGFDTLYVNGFEDVDLCLRMEKAEMGPCIFEPASVVWHEESKTPGRGAMALPNRKIYTERWRQPHQNDDLYVWRGAGYQVATYGQGDVAARNLGMAVWNPTVVRIRDRDPERLRWAIKIGAPWPDVRHRWGDYHFALGLKAELEKQGQEVVIDCKEAWYRKTAHLDDVVLVLRGLSRYGLAPDQINMMWLISHPDEVSDEEAGTFDHVFVASAPYAQKLRQRLPVPVEALLQATDPSRFLPGTPNPELSHDVLFVGNSRLVDRPVVRHALEAGVPLSVFGGDWEEFVPPEVWKGEHIPNSQLPAYYQSAGVVLNDHWEDMLREGFISNRLFDLAACGTPMISDEIAGLTEIFGRTVATYRDPAELPDLIKAVLNDDEADAERQVVSDRIRREHSFEARATTLLSTARTLYQQRRDERDQRLSQNLTAR